MMVRIRQSDIKKATREFVAEWKNRGEEDRDYVEFWEDLLEDVFGSHPAHVLRQCSCQGEEDGPARVVLFLEQP